MNERVASCSCGRLTARVSGEPVRISICHCHACQRRTGSVFGVHARFRREDVRLEGESTAFAREADDGGTVTSHFCPRCGATVTYEMEARLGLLVPSEMLETYEAPMRNRFSGEDEMTKIVCRATYSDFKRFETSGRLVPPK